MTHVPIACTSPYPYIGVVFQDKVIPFVLQLEEEGAASCFGEWAGLPDQPRGERLS